MNKGMTPKEETRKKPVVCFSAGVNIRAEQSNIVNKECNLNTQKCSIGGGSLLVGFKVLRKSGFVKKIHFSFLVRYCKGINIKLEPGA